MNKDRFCLIFVVVFGSLSISTAHAEFSCPASVNVHMGFRTDVEWVGVDSAEFTNSDLAAILGVVPNIVDAGLGTATIAGVAAACDSEGCADNGAHFAFTISGAGGALGANLVGDAYTSNIPFNFTAEEHVDWLFNGDGLKIEQSLYDAKAGGEKIVKVIPVILSSPEHGLWWHDEELPTLGKHRALPNHLEEAEEMFAGRAMRFFGNGGRLMAHVFGISNQVTPGLTPYSLMKIEEVLGVDFLSPAGDLDVFFDRHGLNILNSLSETDPAGPITNFGYSTFYAKGWHQEFDLYEMMVNQRFYDNCLSDEQRQALEDSARNFLATSHSTDVARQCQALKTIRTYLKEVDGSYHNKAWPRQILAELKSQAYDYFSSQATPGSDWEKVFNSMNAYKPYVPHDVPKPDSCEF